MISRCAALLLFDYLLTLSGEIKFVWGRKFSFVTVLFALNRYVTLLSKVFLFANELYWPGQTDSVRRQVCVIPIC